MIRLGDEHGHWLELTPLRLAYPPSADIWDGAWMVARFAVCDGDREWTSQPEEVATLLRHELLGLSDWMNALAACARAGEERAGKEWEALEPSIAFRASVIDGRVALDVRLGDLFGLPETNDVTAWAKPVTISFAMTPLATERFAVALGAETALASTR